MSPKAKRILSLVWLALPLSIVVAVIVVAAAYRVSELGWDLGWTDPESLYRVHLRTDFPDRPASEFAVAGPGLAPFLEANLGGVAAVTRAQVARETLARKTESFERRVAHVDRNFFAAMGPKFRRGSPADFTSGQTAVLTLDFARILADGRSLSALVGERITLETGAEVKIVGILEKLGPTHLDAAAFVNGELAQGWQREVGALAEGRIFTYLRLLRGTNPESVRESLRRLSDSILPQPEGSVWKQSLVLRPVPAIHMEYTALGDITPPGNPAAIAAITYVTALALALTLIDIVGLSIMQTMRERKNIGLRKIHGATARHLALAFLKIYWPLALMTLVLGSSLGVISSRHISAQTAADIQPDVFFSPALLAIQGGIAVIGLFTAVLYPILVGARVSPAACFKGLGKRGRKLRRMIVSLQFAAVVVIGTFAFIVKDQISFATGKGRGFTPDSLQAFVIPGGDGRQRRSAIERIAQSPAVAAAAGSWVLPGAPDHSVGDVQLLRAEASSAISMSQFAAGPGFLDTLEVRLAAGRDFRKTAPIADGSSAPSEDPPIEVIVNETAVRALGMAAPQEALGAELTSIFAAGEPRNGRIVGVVEDFHLGSVRDSVMPTALHNSPGDFRFVIAKPVAGALAEMREAVREILSDRFPGAEIRAVSIPRLIANNLREDRQLLLLLASVGAATLLIASIGFAALSFEAAHAGRREMAIRRVFGANRGTVFRLLLARLTIPALLGACLAVPLAYWVGQSWLGQFAERIAMGVVPFAATLAVAVVISLLLAAFAARRTANALPVEELRVP